MRVASARYRATSRDIGAIYAPFATSTPLWYYILAEAKAIDGRAQPRPVGGRIVTETLIGLLRADPTSYLSLFPGFQPFLGTDLQLGSNLDPNITGNRTYTRAHFLYYAGVVTPGHLPLRSSRGAHGLLTPTHVAILMVVLLLIVGPNAFPETGRALGSGIREFKDAITGNRDSSSHGELEPPPKP